MPPRSHSPQAPDFIEAVDAAIAQFLDSRVEIAERIGAMPLLEQARFATAGGKRLRAAFCWWGYVAAAPVADAAALTRAAASLELLQASLLVHDDIIDNSDTRRGAPSAHRAFQARLGGDRAESYGIASAILLGDVLFDWSIAMLESSGLPSEALDRARGIVAEMRSEVLLGQYLDVAVGFDATDATTLEAQQEQAATVLEYKTARYTVARPVQLGATLAGGSPELIAMLGRYGSLVGQAFQLRDDILGVFGDPELIGKPAGDDLREGKRTTLVLQALSLSNEADRTALWAILGTPTDDAAVDRARRIITDSGALEIVEDQIEALLYRATVELDSVALPPEAKTALTRLAKRAATRDR